MDPTSEHQRQVGWNGARTACSGWPATPVAGVGVRGLCRPLCGLAIVWYQATAMELINLRCRSFAGHG
jgi:hypothetical protein